MFLIRTITIAGLLVLGCPFTASAEIKCQEPFQQIDKSFETSAKGKLEGISKILGAGGDVDIKPVVRNLIAEYPNADKITAQYQLIQLTCEMIKNLSISDDKNLNSFKNCGMTYYLSLDQVRILLRLKIMFSLSLRQAKETTK
jgi:hypothetical protein